MDIEVSRRPAAPVAGVIPANGTLGSWVGIGKMSNTSSLIG